MRVHITTLFVMAALNVCSFANELRVGDEVQVKENSMWFQTDLDLTVWQRFAKVATPEVMESYRSVVLGCRQAWQFLNVQSVKILSYEPEENQVQVKMVGPGRMHGTVWWVDSDDCGK